MKDKGENIKKYNKFCETCGRPLKVFKQEKGGVVGTNRVTGEPKVKELLACEVNDRPAAKVFFMTLKDGNGAPVDIWHGYRDGLHTCINL